MASTEAQTRSVAGAKLMTPRAVVPSKIRLLGILILAFTLRIALFLSTDLATYTQQRPELSTPITSWDSLLEAHYLHLHPPTSPVARYAGRSDQQHVSAYHSGTIYHSPLLLPLLHMPLSRHLLHPDDLVAPIAWSLFDVLAGYLLFSICLGREKSALVRKTHVWAWDRSRASAVAAIYLFHPFTIGVCVAKSTGSLENLCVLASIYAALNASVLCMSVAWAFSSLLALYPVLLLPILVQLCLKRAGEVEYEREAARFGRDADTASDVKRARRLGLLLEHSRKARRWSFVKILVLCPLALATGVFVSRAIAIHPGGKVPLLQAVLQSRNVPLEQGWEWAERVYGVILLATDLTPNLGLWWYFFIEIFDHFRDFFLLTFNVHVAAYVVPALIKYRQDPLFGLTVMLGIIAIFKSYPTVGDHALFLSLFSLHSQIFEYLRYPLVSALIYAYCSLLSPAFHHLWLTAGSGNANFFYAITLVWSLGGGMLLLDIMWAWGRDRWEHERPPLRAKRAGSVKSEGPVPDVKSSEAKRLPNGHDQGSLSSLSTETDREVEALLASAPSEAHYGIKPRRRVVVQI